MSNPHAGHNPSRTRRRRLRVRRQKTLAQNSGGASVAPITADRRTSAIDMTHLLWWGHLLNASSGRGPSDRRTGTGIPPRRAGSSALLSAFPKSSQRQRRKPPCIGATSDQYRAVSPHDPLVPKLPTFTGEFTQYLPGRGQPFTSTMLARPLHDDSTTRYVRYCTGTSTVLPCSYRYARHRSHDAPSPASSESNKNAGIANRNFRRAS
jgi:hypothetical protein